MDGVFPSANLTGFEVMIERTANRAVVALFGELDLASRARFLDACASAGVGDVVVDLRGLEFMDCCGYSGIVQAQVELPSAVVCNAVGQPADLLELIRSMALAG